jgi:outer membrane receptor protein involved in Fe transport
LVAVVVTAARTPQAPEHVAATVTVFDEAALRQAPTTTLDGVLRSAPAFSLFRRSDSFTANPTAQGVSLRGLGPSGASRSLVLLDGVPLNDPFGGWVAWTKLPREGLARAEIVPGGGATAWGNAALGGVIQLFSAPVQLEPVIEAGSTPAMIGSRGTLRAAATFGDFGTASGELAVTIPVGRGVAQLLGGAFATDGFTLVAPERRGPIDIAAWSRHRSLTARWRQPLGDTLEFTATARGYEEFRGNGTPYQRNGSREKFASLAVAGQPATAFAWTATAYAQDQSFASTFGSINATRTTETPASDQYAVPSTAFGAAWTGTWKHAAGARSSGGFDARYVRGETREYFTLVNGAFARQRIAGGQQRIGGLYGLHERSLAPALRLTLGGRVDAWNEADGHRRESDRATGAMLRDDHYADRHGTEFSPSIGLVWAASPGVRVRGNAQQAFRRPTLNELYRPFRQGPNVTEANAALRTERVTSGEIGAEWSLPRSSSPPPTAVAASPAPPPPGLTLGASGFWNELRDAVGNVTLARGPGTFPLFGVIAAGGAGRQRLNLDRMRVRGIELSARWQASSVFSLDVAALFNDATVQRASVAPGLVGRQVAQVPRRSATLGAVWRAPGGLVFTPRLRGLGRQFEDDENTLILGETIILDLGLSRALGRHTELFLNAENLGDARLETGRSADGVVNIGTPRLVFGGIRARW